MLSLRWNMSQLLAHAARTPGVGRRDGVRAGPPLAADLSRQADNGSEPDEWRRRDNKLLLGKGVSYWRCWILTMTTEHDDNDLLL
uniref:Uncharacterized protein n=1 Tax=Sphaerodactylus townsendi TaxID=933632 RepID=A0ACB8FS63_9SAUR